MGPSSLAKYAGFISLAGKISSVSISGAVLFVWAYRVYLPLKFEFHGKTCVGKGAMAAETSSPASYLVYYIVWREKLGKLSWSFVWALRTTTTNCRVSFIDFYLVFPTNVRIVFSHPTNNVILLERYCGTIMALPQSLGYLWFYCSFVRRDRCCFELQYGIVFRVAFLSVLSREIL